MKVIIIPGFTSYPENGTYKDLLIKLKSQGHEAFVLPWPYFFPDQLDKYCLTATLQSAREALGKINEPFVILGYSMGGIIATQLAAEFPPSKFGLIVSPYAAGKEDDLAGKLNE